MKLIEATEDPQLFQPWFDGESWDTWRVVWTILSRGSLTEEENEVFRRHTGRENPPDGQPSGVWIIGGRRMAKTLVASLLVVYMACFRDWRPYLSRGERATCMLLAVDRKQAAVALRWVRAFLTEIPMLRAMVERETATEISLSNSVDIVIVTAAHQRVRGYAVPCVVLDEIGFWPEDDAAFSAQETINALRPAMAQFPGSLMIGISSPHRKSGPLWDAHRRYYGVDDDNVLVWQAPTLAMNPTLDPDIVARAYEEDPAVAASEWGGEFRDDIDDFVNEDTLEPCIVPARTHLPPAKGIRYHAFCDPSGGKGDSFTLCIAHQRQDEVVVVDLVEEVKPPFNPTEAVRQLSGWLWHYGIGTVTGDRYGGEWPREAFRSHGVEYELSGRSKNELYLDLLPRITSRRLELPTSRKLVKQLTQLERRKTRSGRDIVDHPRGSHDDLANSVAGAVALASEPVAQIGFLKLRF